MQLVLAHEMIHSILGHERQALTYAQLLLPRQIVRSVKDMYATSASSGKGADPGGLAGADAHCQRLATAAGASGASGKTCRAYAPAGKTPVAMAVGGTRQKLS